MHLPPRIKDSVLYAWNADSALRDWADSYRFPSQCGHRYCVYCSSCSRVDAARQRNEEERYKILSQIEHNRRVRQLRSRKRALSVSSKRWREREASQCSLLLKLSTELRIKIYEELLVDTEETYIMPGRLLWDALNVRSERRFFPQILRTCRRIYCEALPILYSNNTFTFNSATPLFAFFTSVPLKQLSWIRTLTLAIVLLKDAMNFDSESLYKDPLNLHHYSRLLKLFARLPGNRTVVCLSYRIANKTYMQYPRLGDFALLSKFDEAKKKKMDHVAMFYEIVGALSEDEGRLMFGRWKVGERVDIK